MTEAKEGSECVPPVLPERIQKYFYGKKCPYIYDEETGLFIGDILCHNKHVCAFNSPEDMLMYRNGDGKCYCKFLEEVTGNGQFKRHEIESLTKCQYFRFLKRG